MRLKATYSWPVLAIAAGAGMYAAGQVLINHLPPNTDVAGLLVGALGFVARLVGKKHEEVRGDLKHLAEVYERFGSQHRDHELLEGQVAANKKNCDRVAQRVDSLADITADLGLVAGDHADHIETLLAAARLSGAVARPG